MEMVVIKFRENDLNPSTGRQIEFNKTLINQFFKFKKEIETTIFTYKSLDENDSNNNTAVKVVLKRAPARNDYKVYQNEDGSLFLKNFLLDNLMLNEKNINDYIAIRKAGKENYEFTYIPIDSEIGSFFKIHNLGIDGGSIINNDYVVDKIDRPHNRIVFGAPGTGKSLRLKEESEMFEKQAKKVSDKLEEIKQAVFEADNSLDKMNKFIAIGFKYSNELKEYTKKKISEDFNLGITADNIYMGAQSERYYSEIGDDAKLVDEIGKAKSIKGDGMLQYLTGIGFKFAAALSDYTKEELKKEFNLDSNPQVYWIYRAVHGAKYIEEKEQQVKYLERVTFHPNYSYAQFVGTYKPVQDINNEDNIRYEYVPGPFMRIYVNALKNKDRNFLLLIEEINRANVAAVFGDVFQLLDRDSNGNSEYPITITEDIRKYLLKKGIKSEELSIPSNMYIWATMNSADQGVFPMDTAFKRRWEFEYIGINDNEEELINSEKEPFFIPICKTETVSQKIKWNDLRKAINNKLISLGINEDKLLGPFFLSKYALESAMDNGKDFVKLFESKVLMYLFEDAAKMKVRSLFNVDKYIYSEVCKKFENEGLDVFIFNDEDKVEPVEIENKNKQKTTFENGTLF